MGPSRIALLKSAQQFCDDFANKKDVTTLLSHEVTAIEHGSEAFLAPFLGRTFTGLAEVQKYFETIASLLSYEDMQFTEFVIDPVTRKVAVQGKARFTWLSTGESWDEAFAYILDFDEDNKVAVYQVWADSGAAYLASKGKLDEARKA